MSTADAIYVMQVADVFAEAVARSFGSGIARVALPTSRAEVIAKRLHGIAGPMRTLIEMKGSLEGSSEEKERTTHDH